MNFTYGIWTVPPLCGVLPPEFQGFDLRILKNSVSKVEHFAILIIILALFQNCDTVGLDSQQGFYVLLHFSKTALRYAR